MSFNATQIRTSFVAFGKLSADRDLVIRSIITQLGDPVTYETYESARKLFGEVKREANPNVTAAAVDTAWLTFRIACIDYAKREGFDFVWPEKPAATSAAATKKAAQRKAPEAVEKASTVAQLDAIAIPSDKVEAAKIQAAIAVKKAKLVTLQAKQAEKAVDLVLKARREALIAKIKAMDAAQLMEIEAMVNHDAGIILASLPLPDVQKAMAKLLELASKAPAKVQQKRKSKTTA